MVTGLLSPLPDLVRDVGQKCVAIVNPDKAIENFLCNVSGQLAQSSSAFGVQRDLVACVMVAEDKPNGGVGG